MAISIRGTAGAWVADTATTQTVTLPTHAAGDMLIVRVGLKHATMPTTITCGTAGWTKLGQHNSGTAVSSNGGGSVIVAIFYKEATSAAETNPVITYHASVAATPSAASPVVYQKGAAEAWNTPEWSAGTIAAATSMSATMAAHISTTAGDMVDVTIITNDNTTLTVPTVTQTGVTFGTVSEQPAAALSSATSNDIAADGAYRLASSGTSSAAAVVTGTNSVADEGAAATVRLRVYTPTVVSGSFTADAHIKSTIAGTFTANANIKSTVSGTFTANAHIYIPGDNAYEDEIFLDGPVFVASMEEASGNLTDLIGSKTGTANGAPTYGVTGPIYGKTAIDMAAVTDFFDFADHADLDLGDGPFSIELWYRRDEDTGATTTLLHKGTDGYMVAVTAADQLVLDKVGLAGYLVGETGTTPADGTWHHIVITRSAAGTGNTLIYKDGVEAHVDSQAATALADTTGVLRIGQEASSNRIGGALAYVALYKSVLSSTRVNAHYRAAADNAYENAVLTDNPTFLAPMEEASGNVTDIAGGKVGTLNGTPTYGVTGPINGKTAIDINAGTDFFSFADHADLDLGNVFSLEVWLRRDGDNGGNEMAVAKMGGGAYGVGSEGGDRLNFGRVGTEYVAYSTATIASDGVWHHWVVTHNGSGSGNTTIYKDGVSVSVTEAGGIGSTFNDTTGALQIGREDATNWWPGAIAYVALYKSVLSATRVAAHFNAAAGATVVSGSFTADAHIKNTIAGSFTANSNIRRNDIAGTFTADAYIRQTFASTFTADAYVKKTIAGTFTADANIKRLDIPGSFTADAYIRQTFASSFTANAYIRQTTAGSLTADAYIKNTIAGSFTANANIKSTIAGTWTADAYVKRLDIAGSFTANAYVRQTFSGSVTADAYIRQTFASTFTANAHIKSTVAGTLTADAYVKNTLAGSFTANAQIANVVTGSFTANAHIKNTLAGTLTADAYIRATAAGTFTANAFIRQTYAGTLTADAYIRNVFSGSWTADAYIRRTFNQTLTADAHIKSTVGGTFTANAHIAVTGTGSGTFTADANIRRNGIEATFTADAYIRQTFSGTFTANAYVMKVTAGTFTANAHIGAASAVTYNGSFTADAYIRSTLSGSFSANAYVKRLDIPGSFTADAHIRKTLPGTFVADAYIKTTQAGSFSAEAYIRQTLVGSLTADAFIGRITTAAFTADAYLRGTISGTFTADAWVYNPNAVTRLDSSPSKAGLIRSTTGKSLVIGTDATAEPVYLIGRTSKHG